MIIKKIYVCEICKKTFESAEECAQHETQCNKCNKCDHAYYVYGCEFQCDLLNQKSCGPKLNFREFKKNT